MTRRIVAITVAIVLAALGAAGGLFLIVTADQRAQDRLTDAVTVAIANRPIPINTTGSKIRTGNLVRYERMPRASVPNDVISSIDTSYDKLVLTSNVASGQLLLKANFGTASDATNGGLPLPDGMLAVTVQTGAPEQVAGYVQPGKDVAIFLTYNELDGQGNKTNVQKTRILLPRVEVLAVGTYATHGTDVVTRNTGTLLITVAVNQGDAERLIEGLSHGTLYLGLLTDSVDIHQGPGVDNRDNSGDATPLFK